MVQPYLPCAATQPSPSRLSITPENIPTPLSYAPKSQNAYYCAQSDQRFSWPHSFQCLATPGAGQAADTRSNLGELPDSTVMSGLQAAQLPTEYNTCTGTRTLLRHNTPSSWYVSYLCPGHPEDPGSIEEGQRRPSGAPWLFWTTAVSLRIDCLNKQAIQQEMKTMKTNGD